MSESLAWEKWSSFSNNRYVEEAERFSRPGSVAQKKAFFEAHYKKIAAQKAAALLEQANAASNNAQNQLKTACSNSNEVVNQKHEVKAPYSGTYSIVNDNESSSNAEMDKFEGNIVDGADPDPKKPAFVENPLEVEQSSHLSDADKHKVTEMELEGTPQMEKPLLKVNTIDFCP